jgi:hypothetical protein
VELTFTINAWVFQRQTLNHLIGPVGVWALNIGKRTLAEKSWALLDKKLLRSSTVKKRANLGFITNELLFLINNNVNKISLAEKICKEIQTELVSMFKAVHNAWLKRHFKRRRSEGVNVGGL